MLLHSLHLMLKTILLVVALILIVVAFEVYKIGPRNIIGRLRYSRKREGDLKVGDRASNALLVSLDGRSRQPLLQPTNGKLTVLVFGSFT